ncbi:PIN domain-containing protein [Acidianus sp. HS-5]|uniref:PIN domain-containing protein n=1 Tax=Acidianus sp. HS-5 TaxID=2886040 RepID=UPI001F252509|nr:PIN domain-containing protein [Acidianus sp. HS-5]
MEAVVDTNFIIAVVFKDHVDHEEAIKEWEKLDKAYLPLISVTEIAYFLIKHNIDLNVLSEILSDPKIEVVQNDVEDVYYALTKKSEIKGYDDFNDFLILSTAITQKLPLLTFDKKLKKKMGK